MTLTPEEKRKNYEKRKDGDLSPTQINTLFKCPKSWYYKYIEKLPEAPSIHLVKGIAVHHALEKIFDDKIHKDADIHKVLSDRGEAHYKGRWKRSGKRGRVHQLPGPGQRWSHAGGSLRGHTRNLLLRVWYVNRSFGQGFFMPCPSQ